MRSRWEELRICYLRMGTCVKIVTVPHTVTFHFMELLMFFFSREEDLCLTKNPHSRVTRGCLMSAQLTTIHYKPT